MSPGLTGWVGSQEYWQSGHPSQQQQHPAQHPQLGAAHHPHMLPQEHYPSEHMIEKMGNNLGNTLSLNGGAGGAEVWPGAARVANAPPSLSDTNPAVNFKAAADAQQMTNVQSPNLHLHQHQHHHLHMQFTQQMSSPNPIQVSRASTIFTSNALHLSMHCNALHLSMHCIYRCIAMHCIYRCIAMHCIYRCIAMHCIYRCIAMHYIYFYNATRELGKINNLFI